MGTNRNDERVALYASYQCFSFSVGRRFRRAGLQDSRGLVARRDGQRGLEVEKAALPASAGPALAARQADASFSAHGLAGSHRRIEIAPSRIEVSLKRWKK